jgi:hypothetical protein
MAELITVARPYAEAAFKLAREANALEHWSDMLALIEGVVSDENIASRVGDPNVDERALEGVILGAAGERLDGPARNLVQLLIENGRLDLVPQVRTPVRSPEARAGRGSGGAHHLGAADRRRAGAAVIGRARTQVWPQGQCAGRDRAGA